MSFNYRFSVIPAGAIIDPRLTPRALQVLCLLGRHTNDHGWCSRSQVKMARELDCGRTTIYDAIELLCDTGWVERKANGRGSREHQPGEQPFAAYSYRVKLDREDLPERFQQPRPANREEPDAPPTVPETHDQLEGGDAQTAGGAAQAAGGAAQAAGGAAQAAPLEGISSEGISSEPEREHARAREKRRRGLVSFEQRWPTAAADDRGKTAWAWDSLADDELDPALEGIGPFLDHLKRMKRSAVPAGWKYLEQRRWKLLAPGVDVQGKPATLRFKAPAGSEQWNAWDVFYRCCGQSGIPQFMITGTVGERVADVPSEWPSVGRGIDPRSAFDVEVVEGTGQFAAWLRRLREVPNARIGTRTVIRDRRQVSALRVPCEWPPAKRDEATGPPDAGDNDEFAA